MLPAVVPVILAVAPVQADFYVAPNESDENPGGTEQARFASLAKARDALGRLVREGLDKDVTVRVREGTYTKDKFNLRS